MDSGALEHLEACGAINCASGAYTTWQYRELGSVAQGAGSLAGAVNFFVAGGGGGGGVVVGGEGAAWVGVEDGVSYQLEAGYFRTEMQLTFSVMGVGFQVDFASSQLLNMATCRLFQIRRIAIAPLMPMSVSRV